MSDIQSSLENANKARLQSYLNYEKRVFEEDSTTGSTSNSSVSTPLVKRRKFINYFYGNGQTKWNPKSFLMLNDKNITNALKEFREDSIRLAEETGNINPLRVLSLSYIFPVNKLQPEYSVAEYFDAEMKKDLEKFANKKIEMKKASNDALIYCKAVTDAIDDDEEVEGIDFQPKNVIDSNIKDIVKMFCSRRATHNAKSEATFTDKFVMPFFNTIFLNNSNGDMIYSMIDGYENDKKPDFMLGMKNKKKKVYFFYVEIKREDCNSSHQVEDDFTKLMKEMKHSIDYQIDLKIPEPVSYGLLIEGLKATLYQMKLVDEGLYIPNMLKKFGLPNDYTSFIGIPRVVECLYLVEEELENLRKRIKRGGKNNTNERKLKKISFISKFES